MKIELINVEHYPETTIVTTMLDGTYIVSYAKRKTKDGREFWGLTSHGVTTAEGGKAYIDCFLINNRFEEKRLIDFVKEAGSKAPVQEVSGKAEDLPF